MKIWNVDARWVDVSGFVFAAGLTGLVWLFGVSPRMADGAQSQALAGELADRQKLASDLAARLAAAAAQEQRSKERLASFDLRLSGADQLNRLLRDLNAMAEERGVRIGSLLPGESLMGDPVGKVLVRVQGTGSTGSIDGFVSAIAERFGDVRVQTLRIGVGGESRQGTHFEAELVWFVRPGGSVRGATGS